MRNIGPACGEAGAPTMVRTPGDETRRRCLQRDRPRTGRSGSGLDLRRRGQARQLLAVGDDRALEDKETSDLDPSWSAITTAPRRGTKKPVTRTRSEKVLVDFVTTTSASPGVSFGSSDCDARTGTSRHRAQQRTPLSGEAGDLR